MRLISYLALVAAFSQPVFSQESNSLEDEREKQLQEMGITLPDPESIRVTAAEEFAKPIEEQSIETLEELAENANKYANLVGKIADEYNDYRRENSRYEFVTEVVESAPAFAAYLEADNEFKTIRNRAYLNLGKLALAEGSDSKAFFYFNDAFRLSIFSCSEGVDSCLRHEAEQEMKKLLGIQGDSYVHWQK